MKVLVIFAFVALSVAILTPSKVILADNKLSKRVDGQYIIVFHPNTTAEKRNAHIASYGDKVFHTYAIGDSFFGYAAKFTQQDLISVAHRAEVKYIEEDKVMYAFQSCSKQTGATWGIDRIAEKEINLDQTYVYTSTAGSGVDAYVVDTGILTTHQDFEGRAEFGANFVGDGQNEDCNGHGTHVAGTIGSKTYGVAKKTTLIAVKVLGCNGSGTTSGVVKGINFVADEFSKRGKKPSVANMSLGGGKSTSINDAVAGVVRAGVTMVVAAGNENQDACNVSPASEPVAITVGATDIEDENTNQVDVRSSFSNYGTCVKILAPGSLITSTYIGSNTATRILSGTSMASPHVAGSAALFLGNNPDASPTQVLNHLVSTASTGIVDLACSSSACQKTPNKFVYNECD